MTTVKDEVVAVADQLFTIEQVLNQTFDSALLAWKTQHQAMALTNITAILNADPDKTQIVTEFENDTNGTRIMAGDIIIITHVVQPAQISQPVRDCLVELTTNSADQNAARVAALIDDINAYYVDRFSVRTLAYDPVGFTLTLQLVCSKASA